MPITAFGRYEVAVMAASDGEAGEYCTRSFFFFPVIRIIGLALLLAVAALLAKRPWRSRKMGAAWWLAAPPALTLPGCLFIGGVGSWSSVFMPLLMGQMTGVALCLLCVCRLQQRRRAVSLLLIVAINAGTLALAAGLLSGMHIPWIVIGLPALLISQLWTVPVVCSCIFVRNRFSAARLLSGLVVSLAVLSVVICLVAYAVSRSPGSLASLLVSLLVPLPYLIVFFLFAACNPWCREGLKRALDIGKPETGAVIGE